MSTLTSSMHRPRTTHTPPPAPSSYQPRPSSQSTIVPSSESFTPTHTPRRPSASNTMHWLSRSSTQNSFSTPYSPSKPIKVSEPKLVRGIDSISSPPRSGTLGSGATVVRTPDEALRETGVRLGWDKDKDASSPRISSEKLEREKEKERKAHKSRHTHKPSASKNDALMISPPTSPPLPPLPLPEEDEEKQLETSSNGSKTPPRPSRTPPPAPLQRTPSKRSSMKVPRAISITNSTAEELPTVPPLPSHIAASTQPPPFSPILISEPPSSIVDASKLIVTLETCTTTYKTTLATLTSRPSHLSEYFSALFHASDSTKSVRSSVYSTESDDVEMYRHHLTSQGLVPLSSNVHIFLDRPSAPYVHILTYLRTPVVEGQSEVLPRALQLQISASSSSSTQSSQSADCKLDALIEVRDEAAYLNLEGLHKLCTDEIRHRYGPARVHHRGNSSSSVPSIHSLHASVYSLRTLIEHVESDIRNSGISSYTPPAHSDGHNVPSIHSSTPASAPAGPLAPSSSAISIRRSKQMNAEVATSRSPPTPQSWDGSLEHQRSQSRQSERSRPPVGWI